MEDVTVSISSYYRVIELLSAEAMKGNMPERLPIIEKQRLVFFY
jgi:hypothetical protein